MNNLKDLLAYCNQMIDMYPALEDIIVDLYQNALMEIEGGESEFSECQLAFRDIQSEIREYNETKS